LWIKLAFAHARSIMNHSKDTALITGGSSGIGYAMAKEFAARGCDLVLVSDEEERLADVKGEFERDYAVMVQVIHMNLAQQYAAQQLYAECARRNLEISILVNNAGLFSFGETVEVDLDRSVAMLNLNVITPSILAVLFGSDMKRRGRGYIVFVSSISAYRAFPGISFYGSTKRYLLSFAQSMRCELADTGVSVTCICPGATATDLYDRAEVPVNMNLALKLGVMSTPDRVARLGVDAMFKKRAICIPGVFNKVAVGVSVVMPQLLIDLIKAKTGYLK
jgi:short-subunit dehydrogenase